MRDGSLESAKRRTKYTLTFDRSTRELQGIGLSGRNIPCAYEGIEEDGEIHQAHDAPGSWIGESNFTSDDFTEEDWIHFWMRCAIEEAVHEVLEHFQVDGAPLLDPHGELEGEVFDATGTCAEALVKILKHG
jgi:hypothetical protein